MSDLNLQSDLKSYLKSCVRVIKKGRPHMNSSRVAAKLGIPTSTLCRIENEYGTRPSFPYAMKLVREAAGDQNIKAFIQKFYPEMLGDFEEIYPQPQDVQFIGQKVEAYFENSLSHELMMLISSGRGVTRGDISFEFGRKGVKILEHLLAKDIVKEKNGRIIIEGNINATQATVHKLLKNLINSNYDINGFGKRGNWLTVQYEAVNHEKVWPEVKDVIEEANKKIRKIFTSPESKGNDVIWVGLIADSLQKVNPSKLQGGVQ